MGEEEKKSKHTSDVEELSQVLETVSTQVPNLIRGLISSVFSEEAGRNMGRAAAAYYKELKDGGIPNEEALRMTREYMTMLTDIGKAISGAVGGGKGRGIGEGKKGEEMKGGGEG